MLAFHCQGPFHCGSSFADANVWQWRLWQSKGAVGLQGSLAHSVSQALNVATMDWLDHEDLNLSMVIEMDMVQNVG